MKMWNKRHRPLDLDALLHDERPEPREALLRALGEKTRGATPRAPRRLQLAFAGGLTVVLLVGLSAVGGMSYAASTVRRATHDGGWTKVTSAEGQYGHKVKMCHKGKTIDVDEHAVPAHLKQGDTRGACKAPGKPATRAKKAKAKQHKASKPAPKKHAAKPKPKR
jgi:hypothetical protein